MTILGVYGNGNFTAIFSTMPLLAGKGGRSTLDPGGAWPCGARCQMGSGLTRSKPVLTGYMADDGDTYAPGTGAPIYAQYITFDQANATVINTPGTALIAAHTVAKEILAGSSASYSPTAPGAPGVQAGQGTPWALGIGVIDGREGARPIHRYQPYPNATTPTERKANAILSRFSYITAFAIQWGNGNNPYDKMFYTSENGLLKKKKKTHYNSNPYETAGYN